MKMTELTALIGACMAALKVIWDMVQSNRNLSNQISEVLKRMSTLESNQQELHRVGQANSLGNRNLTRYRIRQEMLKAIRQGYETYDNFQEVVNLVDGYHAAGGNGAIDALFDEYKNLPRKEA
ncbi:hypothetical protein [Abiotrophia defectiva]|jgi:hypothetical protein|uniref:hypothetical protein n=2 Tax=Abiotrophia TaxID=46123 RepID=UPI00205F6DA9|nr:hypothetical protein [Abiotrophia defectiva]DAX58129.1 MAG TPA: hypothetical protein [Caudoviricetes sp.]